MSDRIVVRPARAEELTEVGEIALLAYRAEGLVPAGSPYADRLTDSAGRHREAELLVAADHTGRLLGTVTVARPGTPWAQVAGPDEIEFRMLAVHPDGRGRGIGRALVDSVLDRARAEGFRGVALSTLESMRTAHHLYERIGFRRAPHRDWNPNESVALWVFEIELAVEHDGDDPGQVRQSGHLGGAEHRATRTSDQ
jgi:ribosomal protein S18 acetylase RimI-like enzyme